MCLLSSGDTKQMFSGPCLRTHKETNSIIAAPSWIHCCFFLIFLVYKFLQHKSTNSSLTDAIFTDFIRGSLWFFDMNISLSISASVFKNVPDLLWFFCGCHFVTNKALFSPNLNYSNKDSCHLSSLWLHKACPLGWNVKVEVLVSSRIKCCDLWNPCILESTKVC